MRNGPISKIFMIVLGIVIIVVSLKLKSNASDYVPVTGKIIDITSEYDPSDEETDYHVFVEYTVDGETYQTELGEYRSSFSIGDEVDMKYNLQNPASVESASGLFYLVWIGLGALCILVGAGSLFRRR